MRDSSKFKDDSHLSSDVLLEKLSDLGISYSKFLHPPLFTVQDAKKYQKDMVGLHVKNLFLRDKKKNNFLIVAEQDSQIDLKFLHEKIGSNRLSFGSSDRLMEFLGVRPGAVSPLALINDISNSVKLFFDSSLDSQETLHFHPLINDITIGIKLSEFYRFLKFTGHKLTFVKI